MPKPGKSRPHHRQHHRRALGYKEDSELQAGTIRRGMSFLDFGLGLSIFFAVVAPLKRSRIACQKPNIVRGWVRTRKKPSTKKEKGPPGVSNDKEVYLSDPRDPSPVVKLKGGAGLCPVHELEALNLDSSDDSESSGDEVLDTDEEAELEEEAARYEEERYHLDEHRQNSKEPRRQQLQASVSQVVPSAPPPYERRPKSYSFLPEKVKRKLGLAFPIFEGIEGECMHAPMEYNQIKELAESVRKYGVTANFTLTQLDRLALNALTPSDWQMVTKAALVSMGQYMEWKALWHEAAQEQARANATALTPEQQLWTFDLLTGQGRFAADQTNYHWGAYPQIDNAAIRA